MARPASPPPLPPRASTARVVLFVLALVAVFVVPGYAGTGNAALVAVLVPGGLVAAAALVFVAARTSRDFTAAAAPLSGPPVVTSSRWDWTDVLAFLPATLALLAFTDLALVTPTHAADASFTPTARTAVDSFAEQAAFYAAALLALAILVLARRGLRVVDLGWRLPRRLGPAPWWVWIPLAAVVAYGTLLLAGDLGQLSQSLLPAQPNTQCTSVRTEYHGYVLIALPLVCVIAPLAEETIFRGFFYGWLRRHLPVVPAVAVGAAVFAVSHSVLVLALPLFAVGAVLALLYEASGSLIPGAIVHALFNLVGIIQILGPTTTC
ncbi:MAG: CPBP family intramembrane glutamic endopeptidase [Candidatus Dormibacteria bacterium]